MIQVENVVKWFGPTLAVDDVSFEVSKGEVLGFLGPNGAGKSTTMRIITGFLPVSSGSVKIGGNDIDEDSIAAKSLIGYLPESAPAYPEMTVEGFLDFVAEIRGYKGVEKRETVERAISTCFLESVRYQPVDTLSKGYKHRTCFAQAILHDPPVLILDEPTDGLDPNQKHEMRQLIKEMGKEKTIIVSTHILEEVEAICTRVIIIDRGKVVFNGSPEELRGRSPAAGNVVVRVLGQNEEAVKEWVGTIPGGASVVSTETLDGAVRAQLHPTASATANGGLSKAVMQSLAQKGWEFDQLTTLNGRLDEVFREITVPDTVQEDGK